MDQYLRVGGRKEESILQIAKFPQTLAEYDDHRDNLLKKLLTLHCRWMKFRAFWK
jgi:hypothetical protein